MVQIMTYKWPHAKATLGHEFGKVLLFTIHTRASLHLKMIMLSLIQNTVLDLVDVNLVITGWNKNPCFSHVR